MNYALVQNGAWWQGLALSALGTGRKPALGPQFCQGPQPFLSEGPSSRALCLSLEAAGALSSTNPQWEISLCTTQHILAVSGINTIIRSWSHPKEAGPSSKHVPAAASDLNGQGWASEKVGVGKEGLISI